MRSATAPGSLRVTVRAAFTSRLRASGTKLALDQVWMIVPAPREASGKGFSSAHSQEEDGEAGGPREGGCSPPDEADRPS